MSEDVAEILGTGTASALRIEENGINVIAEDERKGQPRELFWPWFGANISVLGLSYGAWVLAFRISFLQAIVVGSIGIVVSFWLCGVIATAGKRGSAPTMVLSRAAYGVRGNRLPSVISWLLCVGWETALTVIAVLATSTIFARLGVQRGRGTKVFAMLVVAALIIVGGVMGFDLIMRMQAAITVVTGGLDRRLHRDSRFTTSSGTSLPTSRSGSAQSTMGALVFLMTGFGLGWVNVAADYSRYLPAQRIDEGRRVVDDLRRIGGSFDPAVLRAVARWIVGVAEHRGQAPTRSARWRTCCRLGSSCRS